MTVYNKVFVEFGTPDYDETIKLRTLVLRKPLNLEFSEEQLAAEYTDTHLALMDESNNIVACLLLTKKDDETAKMRQVAVSPDLQGQGLGKQLVSFFEEVAIHNSYKKIELNARATAIPFYESMNYQKVGKEFIEVGISHFKMVKNLV